MAIVSVPICSTFVKHSGTFVHHLFLYFVLANGVSGTFSDAEVKADQLMGSVLASSGDLFVVRYDITYTLLDEISVTRPRE